MDNYKIQIVTKQWNSRKGLPDINKPYLCKYRRLNLAQDLLEVVPKVISINTTGY
jgi:hypothetical protein